MRPGDRLVCAFVERLMLGDEFKEWPLHVTIVPWLRLDKVSDELSAEIQAVLNDVSAFQVNIGEETKFGRGKIVNFVQQPTPFIEIEKKVRQLLKDYGAWLVDETTKRRRSFKPHVTAQSAGRLFVGDVFICDQLCIVEQKGDYKKVVGTMKFH